MMSCRKDLLLSGIIAFTLTSSVVAFASTDEGGSQLPQGVSVVEFEEYQSARARYSSRANELAEDTRAWIDSRERLERAALSQSYDSVINTLAATEKEQRRIALEKFQEFLLRHPDHRYSDDIRFRLADLKWEQSSEDWLASYAEYDELEARLVEEDRYDEVPDPPELDLSETIALYQAIIDRNLTGDVSEQFAYLDGVYYMLGFAYKDENAQQRDEDKALASFNSLIERHPDSSLIDTAHMYVASLLFDANRHEEAVEQYVIVMENGTEGRHYMGAMYNHAWSFYIMSGLPEEYAVAMDAFDGLLERSSQLLVETGRRSDYETDAIKYIAHSIADVAEMTGDSPVDVGEKFFSRRKYKGYEATAYADLANVLEKYGRYAEAIEVYGRLQQPPWENDPLNPQYQLNIVKLHASNGDQAAASQARVDLTERYNETSSWWYANRNHPDALQKMRFHIEDSLSTVAKNKWQIAEASGDSADYAAAADKFKEYLITFPVADNYYEHQWLLGASLHKAKIYDEAEAEYRALMESKHQHGYGDSALWQLADLQYDRLKADFGAMDADPRLWGAEVISDESSESSVQYITYGLSEQHQAFIDMLDRILDHEFSVSSALNALDSEAIAQAAKKRTPAYMYMPGQILMTHGQYDGARERFFALIEAHPESDDAARAAAYVLDSYTNQDDLANLRKYAKIYATMQLGSMEDKTEEFATLEQGAAFKQAAAFAEAGEREQAALAYREFYQQYPDSENAPNALLNAAFNYEKMNRQAAANEIFEEFVNVYPDHERSKNLLFQIASNYETTFELEQAVQYYERLVSRFPDSENARNALYNAAFLKVGLGEYEAAARAYESYATSYPESADAEETYYRAGAQWEQVGPSVEASFWRRFLKTYPEAEPNRLLSAKIRLSALALESGDSRRNRQYLQEIIADYERFVASGVDVGFDGKRAAAAADFPRIQALYDDFTDDVMTGDEAKDGMLINSKGPDFVALEADLAAYASKYGNFEYIAAAWNMIAGGYLYLADLYYNIECPPQMDEESCDLFMEYIYETFYPKADNAQAKAVSRLERIQELGVEKGEYNNWIAQAANMLNEIDPTTYPSEKMLIRGTLESTTYQTVEALEFLDGTEDAEPVPDTTEQQQEVE